MRRSAFNPDLQAKLIRLAAHQGRASEVLVVEAVERRVNYDERLLREVEKGLTAADRGWQSSQNREEQGRTGRKPDTRELMFTRLPYLAIYLIREDAVEIVRLLHGAQEWP